MPPKKVFEKFRSRTHMPFCDGKDLVFCASNDVHTQEFKCGGTIWNTLRVKPWLRERFTNLPQSRSVQFRAWKIYHSSWPQNGTPERLETGLPASAVECSPSFYRDKAGQLHISFVGGASTDYGLVYHLYEMSGASFDELGLAEKVLDKPTMAGFVNSQYICFLRDHEIVLLSRDTQEETILECPMQRVLRISYCSEDITNLLITGICGSERQTLIYNIQSEEVQELSTPDGAYKPTVFGKQMLFVKKEKSEIENCQVHHEKLRFVHSNARIQRRCVGK